MTFSEYRVYLVLFLIALSSWLLADLFEEKEIMEQIIADNSPDYFSSGYYKKEMDKEGLLKNELEAEMMVHYSEDGTTHLDKLVMTLHNPQVPPWVIQSETGILESDGDHLLLGGKVIISRAGTKKLRALKIKTSELKVKLSTNYAETDQRAEIIDASNRTKGVGMSATFVDPIRLKLLSRVKGRYEFN